MNMVYAHAALSRLLEALELELIDASDAEILQAAKDLGMNPEMKGSAAFAGVTYRAKPRLYDFYAIGGSEFDLSGGTPKSRHLPTPRQRKEADDK